MNLNHKLRYTIAGLVVFTFLNTSLAQETSPPSLTHDEISIIRELYLAGNMVDNSQAATCRIDGRPAGYTNSMNNPVFEFKVRNEVLVSSFEKQGFADYSLGSIVNSSSWSVMFAKNILKLYKDLKCQ